MKTKRIALIFVAMTFFAGSCLGQQSVADSCLKDLDVIPDFLLANDAGAKTELAQLGQKHFDDALDKAEAQAARVSDAHGCLVVLNTYLKSWRKGHLEATPGPSADTAVESAQEQGSSTPPRDSPTFQILSSSTVLLTLKSFGDEYRLPLIALLQQNHSALAKHSNWIIDVRGNGGGSDSSYDPILAWLLPDETVSVGAMWLATPANLEGHKNFCALYAPGDSECEKEMQKTIDRVRNAAAGSLVPQRDGGGIAYDRQQPLEPQRPSRIAILIDGECASSCEEFLLAARQSFSVKLIGRSTFGSLDYSNLRPFSLPSGQRLLWYATSQSMRIPGLSVDVAGIQPDIYLPLGAGPNAKVEEMIRVRNWLEGGSLAPANIPSSSKQSGHQ